LILKELSFHHEEEVYYYRNSFIQLFRPMTLTGTISPILVGTGFAGLIGPIHYDAFFALLISTLLIQAATNMLNDYYDFKNGQDLEKWTTDKQEYKQKIMIKHHCLLPIAITILIVASIIGLWLSTISTFRIIPVGIIGIAAGYRYSAGNHSFSAIGLGEVIAAVFLGGATTILAYVVQGNSLNFSIILLSIPFATLIASMILTNNIRDIEKDRHFRKTIAIYLGRKNAVSLLIGLIITPYVSVALFTFTGLIPWTAGIVFLASPVAFKLCYSYRTEATRMEELNGMKWAARHHWIFGLLFAAALWIL